jgi:hypothetical protein
MVTGSPPAYAWDWFARQRLLWREVRSRLARSQSLASMRYRNATAKSDVMPLLQDDYAADDIVRSVVDGVVAELAFLSRTDVPFAQLGVAAPPRGMRWWWTALTGERLEAPPRTVVEDRQLSIDNVLEGYGDR